jgi:Domain of unknown function (DUF4150)
MATTFANGRGIAHQGSSGQTPVFPDVCNTPTPGGPVPIPYPNLGQSSNTTAGPTSVTTDGVMPMTQDAQYIMSSGDEAGSAMGVMSGTITGPCEFMMYSFDVQFEGKNVCRLGDPLYQNNKNAMG